MGLILRVSVNVFGQLGFLGNTNDTVWLLITLSLSIIVLYAPDCPMARQPAGATGCAGGHRLLVITGSILVASFAEMALAGHSARF